MRHRIISIVIFLLLVNQSCKKGVFIDKEKSFVCKFTKSIIFKDSLYINKCINSYKVVDFLNKKFPNEIKKISKEDLKDILFLSFSYLKIHPEELRKIKSNFDCSKFNIQNIKNKDYNYQVEWKDPFNKKTTNIIFLDIMIKENKFYIEKIYW